MQPFRDFEIIVASRGDAWPESIVRNHAIRKHTREQVFACAEYGSEPARNAAQPA